MATLPGQDLPSANHAAARTGSAQGKLLTTAEAAQVLRMSRARVYQLLAESNAGQLMIRGRPVTISYFQGGARGQGRIWIEIGEVQRIQELMRVYPRLRGRKRPRDQQTCFPGITVRLGRPAS